LKLKTITLLAIITLASGSAIASSGQGMHNFREMMNHANPMPNLMQVIRRHEDQLNLSNEQSAALASWRKAHHKIMHDKVMEVNALEKAMYDAAMSGKSKEEVMKMAAELQKMRQNIISTKLDCRDNMRRVLNADQYAKVLKIYAGS